MHHFLTAHQQCTDTRDFSIVALLMMRCEKKKAATFKATEMISNNLGKKVSIKQNIFAQLPVIAFHST